MKLKKILLAINIILTGLILWTSSILVMTWTSKKSTVKALEDGNPKKEEKGLKLPGPDESMSNYQAIIRQDIFHTTQQRPVARAPKAEVKKIVETSLNLKLKGVVIRSNNRSFAVIMDDATQKEDIYYLNDRIRNARVAKILRDQVILEVNNRQEAIFLFAQSEEIEGEGTTSRTTQRQPLRPAVVMSYPPPDPSKSSLGADVASRLPAMIRRKKR